MPKALKLLLVVGAVFAAVWVADRMKPDRLDRRKELIAQIEGCRKRLAEAEPP